MFLNTFYIQKSRLILLPILGIKLSEINPLKTYIAYKDVISNKDYKLICEYKRDNKDYYQYRNENLFKHPKFEKLYRGLFSDFLVFNLEDYKKDYDYFISGKYSKLSKELKKKIKEFYSNSKIGPLLLDTHLNPEDYHEIYAKEFKVDVKYIKNTHETLTPPDLKKEHFT